jgi:hypothetical protein
MAWFTKFAKPPSPVQIRAAPPIFLEELIVWLARWLIEVTDELWVPEYMNAKGEPRFLGPARS